MAALKRGTKHCTVVKDDELMDIHFLMKQR